MCSMKSALARLTTTALVGLFSAFSADAVLFRGNAVQLKTDSDGSHWVNCAEQGQTCTCDSQVRWGTGDTWLVLEPSQSGEVQNVKCDSTHLKDILPGSVDKHCECKADWKHISPMMLSDSEAQKENAKLVASCDLFQRGEGDGPEGAAQWRAHEAFCSNAWLESARKDPTLDAGKTGWLPRAFVNYFAGDPHAKHAMMTEELIASVHAFSAVVRSGKWKGVTAEFIIGHLPYQTTGHNQGSLPTREQLKLEEDLVAERQQHGDITRIAMPDSKVVHFGFNFNKFRAYLLARVKTGVGLDSDQFVAPGVDQLFSSTEREITKDYPLPIMPVHFLDRVMDVTEDEDVLIIGLWEEKAIKQWCKFDIPDPDEFTWFSLWSPSERSHCSNCPDISGDSRFYPHSAAKAFWTAHHAVRPENTIGWIQKNQKRQQDGTWPKQQITFKSAMAGASLKESFLEEGFILEKKISVGHKKVLENCNVLVANCQMDTDKIKIYGARVKVDSYEAIAEIEQAEKDKMKTKVDKICKHGCNVFINRQLIYNYPDQLFKDHGVMAIEHSDFEGSERLAAVLGSDIVSTFDNPELTKLGFCKRIEEIMIGEDKVIKFSGCAQGEACTIVLRGSSQHVLDEAERSLHDALAVLYQTVTETRVVWGGGSMEMAMADAVQKKMADIGGKEMAAMEQFGKALISIPAILADNGGLDSQELVGQLRAAHAKGKHTMGLEFNGGTVACMAGLGIMESFRSKLNQLCSAAEAAEMIIRVDDIIKNAPRQREG
ncbi:unnamed protein product [Polarella glacialis]|uniref:CCT-beta n=1 Tax=Polarella glacialis TaxID=89957 RepID=A0A813L4R3_POLGL|nr:unnamed protein product [Polarella glacialis]